MSRNIIFVFFFLFLLYFIAVNDDAEVDARGIE